MSGHLTLPLDPEGMNDASAERAGGALRHFQKMTGPDDEDALGDLLCDLLHWCDRNDFAFDLALERAQGNTARRQIEN